MRSCCWLLGLSLLGGCSRADSDQHGDRAVVPGKAPLEELAGVLRSSRSGAELEKAAHSLCALDNAKALDLLLGFLRDPDFWERLDPPTAYHGRLSELRLSRILQSVARLPPEKANKSLLILAGDSAFTTLPKRDHGEKHVRTSVLMKACGEVQQPTEQLLDFLDSQAKPGSGHSHYIVPIFAMMRSPAACKRMERHFHAAVGDRNLPVWFTMDIIVHRNDPSIVDFYRRLLSAEIRDAAVRNTVVQSLFDFRPKDWYHSHKVAYYAVKYKPPSRRAASTQVLKSLKAIGCDALKLDLTEVTKGGVRSAIEEIESIIKFRRDGGPEHVAQLIRKLDDKSFRVREQATLDLENYGALAETAITDALRSAVSVETRQRLLGLLRKLGM